VAYTYSQVLIEWIIKPLDGEKLIYLTPGGGFNFIFQVSMYAGLLVAAPLLMYQIYGFIRPALPLRAQRSAIKVVSAAFLLMIIGVAYGYFVALPSALHFLSHFAGSNVIPSLTADSYLSFFLAYIAGLGILFQLPLLLLFIHWIRPMTPKGLLRSERFVILFAFVVAAIITPTPDMFNQLMIALPLILIYQFSVIAILIALRRARRSMKYRNEEQKPAAAPVGSLEPPQQAPKKEPALAPGLAATSSARAGTPMPSPYVAQPALRRPVRRTVDGFARATIRPVPRTASRPQTVVARPTRVASMRPSARRLSIDGLSSIS